MKYSNIPEEETYYAPSRADWRHWLEQHHQTATAIWLVCYKQASGKPSLRWSEAVDEALCFGWIDGTRISEGEDRFLQYFTRRKPTSIWSKINKEKVERLSQAGLITPAGQASIDIAQQNGSWTILDTVEAQLIPDDLQAALDAHPGAQDYFNSLSKTVQKMMLYHLVSAKRPETRLKRIETIAQHMKDGKRMKGM